MTTSKESIQAWDLYWGSGALESCVTESDLTVSQTLGEFWGEFARRLPKQASVIDLATGNGSVVKQLLTNVSSLQITAVDIAKIQPQTNDSLLSMASFVPNIDITDLPYADGAFDAVSSQFGAEYAMSAYCKQSEARNSDQNGKQNTMVAEAVRVLASHGQLQFLMHNTQSALLQSNHAKLIEFEHLFASKGLIPTLREFALGAASLQDMQRAGEAFLALDIIKTKRISGQVFDAIAYFLQQTINDVLTQQVADVVKRMKAENSRLQQLQNAALSDSDVRKLVANFERAGLEMQTCEPLVVPNGNAETDILGWKIQGRKP